ncbi:hypothetical protein D0N37_02155 [Pseudoalteromonas piscicida]|nr:hypothetical protein D0N37_02155 [Pseudoalteromonas piscicida]
MSATQKICYLVVLNKKFLTQLASGSLLQIKQVLRQIGIGAFASSANTVRWLRKRGLTSTSWV